MNKEIKVLVSNSFNQQIIFNFVSSSPDPQFYTKCKYLKLCLRIVYLVDQILKEIPFYRVSHVLSKTLYHCYYTRYYYSTMSKYYYCTMLLYYE